MKSIILVLVLIENSFVKASITDVFLNTVERLLGDKNNNCANNSYKHDPALSPKLDGYFYNLYTSNTLPSNFTAKFDQIGNRMIFARTTREDDCCTTLNITFGEEYNVCSILTDADCSRKVSEVARLKLIAANTETDGSCCIVMWACHTLRESVHTVCDKRMISQEQTEWIQRQYDQLKLKPLKTEQNVDYQGGKCFKN